MVVKELTLDEKRSLDKQGRAIAKQAGGYYETVEEKHVKRQIAEKYNAVNNLEGIDRRKYSIHLVEKHKDIGQLIPMEMKGLLLVLATLLETKGKGKITNRKYDKLGVSEIAEKLGKHRNTISPLLDEMTSNYDFLEEIKEGNSKHYRLNEKYYACGRQKEVNNFVRMYQSELLDVSKQFNLAELGFLSDLLNYMHCKHHILLRNPDEVHESEMEILRPKDIAILFDMETQVVNKYIRKLIAKKILYRMEVGTGRGIAKVIIVDPTFFSKTAKEVSLDIIKSIVQDKTTLSNKNYIK